MVTRRVVAVTHDDAPWRCHDHLVATQTTPERTPTVTRSSTPRVAHGTPQPRSRTVPVQESGPQRARREAEDEFRSLLSGHIRDMRRRGVSEDVLGPFERELLRLGPAPA